MRSGTALAAAVAGLVVLLGLVRPTPTVLPLELVPPVPSLGVEDRRVNVGGVVPPYGPDRHSLREMAEEAGIFVGAAVEPSHMASEALYNLIIAREFNIVTTENALKLGLVRREPHRYSFAPADTVVDFAAQNGMQVRGHVLVWHEEVPAWLTVKGMNSDQLSGLLQEHIETLVGRYAGRIQYWDVVNEAIDWDGSMRQTLWLKNLGPDYMDTVFHWAHAVDPDARLFYNDFNAEGLNDKSDAVYELVKGMVERGVPIHGVGLQGHFNLENPPVTEEVRANIQRLAELGLEVQFTEVDVRIEEPITPEELEAQAGIYWSMLNVCVAEPACTAFITWGVTDKLSWIPRFIEGYGGGLMFDEDYAPKPAYWALRDVLARHLGFEVYATE